MDVDIDENKQKLSFVQSAVSYSAGWHEPKFMWHTVQERRFQVLRHCVHNGGRRRAAHDKLLPEMLLWRARRNRDQC